MNSSETIPTAVKNYKSKICLLGGQETYKDEFQKINSCASLALQNKANIGVNISRINYNYEPATNFLIYLWNINCDEPWASYRTSFYSGTEAAIVLISENDLEQIIDYFNELQSRLPIITVVFCVILEEHKKEQIAEILYSDPVFESFLQDNNVSIDKAHKVEDIFRQLSLAYLNKRDECYNCDKYIISLIQAKDLFPQCPKKDNCNHYYAPKNESLTILKNRRINVEILRDYLKTFNITTEKPYSECLKIVSPLYGTFSIFLRNGRVYLTPKICESCKIKRKKKCTKYQRNPYFVCIKAKNEGWSNISGVEQPELLVLSKILALQQNKLPKDVIKQIQKINTCIQ